MARVPIPADRGALTADWLASALDANAIGCRLQEVAVEPLGGGEMAEVARCRLRWDGPAEAAAPESVIVKLPSPDLKVRRMAKKRAFYKRECAFYMNLREGMPIRSPALLYGDYEAESERFVLVLEDLCGYGAADQTAGADAAQAGCAIRAAARLHGRFWGTGRPAAVADLSPRIASAKIYRPAMRMVFLASHVRGMELFGGALPADRRRRAWAYGPQIAGLVGHEIAGPKTFVHGGFRLDNLFFGTGGDDTAVIDWQTYRFDIGLFDVAYFLMGSLPAEVRRAAERDLLEEYHGIVCSTGGEHTRGFAFEECWRLYRMCMVKSFVIHALVLGKIPFEDAYGHRLAEVMLERSLAAAEDLEAEGLLPTGVRRWGFANAFSSLLRGAHRLSRARRPN